MTGSEGGPIPTPFVASTLIERRVAEGQKDKDTSNVCLQMPFKHEEAGTKAESQISFVLALVYLMK